MHREDILSRFSTEGKEERENIPHCDDAITGGAVDICEFLRWGTYRGVINRVALDLRYHNNQACKYKYELIAFLIRILLLLTAGSYSSRVKKRLISEILG